MGFQKYPDNKHSIAIDTADLRRVFEQIVVWGEASWWPKHCMMKFTRLSLGKIGPGIVYRQSVKLPFGPKWYAVVQEVCDNKSIRRKFVQSFLDGSETVSVMQESVGSVRVDYVMSYSIGGSFDNFLWKVFLQKLHDANIESILKALKEYVEKTNK